MLGQITTKTFKVSIQRHIKRDLEQTKERALNCAWEFLRSRKNENLIMAQEYERAYRALEEIDAAVEMEPTGD